MAEEESAVTIVSAFENSIASLEETFANMLSSIDAVDQSLVNSTLEHVLLLDSAVESTMEASDSAVEEAKQLVKLCLSLNKELRGTDRLAEKVKQLKRRLRVMERAVDSLAGQR